MDDTVTRNNKQAWTLGLHSTQLKSGTQLMEIWH